MNPLQYKVKLNTRPNLGMFNFAKGILMLLVMCAHSIMEYSYWRQRFFHETIVGFFLRVGNRALSFAVIPAFFIICGYGFRKVSMKKCIQQMRAMWGFYVLSAVAVALLVAICALLTEKTGNESTLTTIWYYILPFFLGMSPATENFFGIRMSTIGVCWFLVAYFFSAIILNLVLKIKKESIQSIIFVILAAISISLRKIPVPFCFLQAMVGSGYMYLGYLLKKKKILQKEIPTGLILVGLAVWAILVKGSYVSLSSNTWGRGIPDLVCTCIAGAMLAIALVVIKWPQNKLTSGVQWVGNNSLLICCTHNISMGIVEAINMKQYFAEYMNIGIILEMLFHCLFSFGCCFLILQMIKAQNNRK